MLMLQSLQKNQAFFLQGLLFLCKKVVFELTIGILAEKRGISCARMAVWSKGAGGSCKQDCYDGKKYIHIASPSIANFLKKAKL